MLRTNIEAQCTTRLCHYRLVNVALSLYQTFKFMCIYCYINIFMLKSSVPAVEKVSLSNERTDNDAHLLSRVELLQEFASFPAEGRKSSALEERGPDPRAALRTGGPLIAGSFRLINVVRCAFLVMNQKLHIEAAFNSAAFGRASDFRA